MLAVNVLHAGEDREFAARAPRWRLVAGLAGALCLSGAAGAFAQFTPSTDHTRAILEGNWQSCREEDGQYSERVYDGNLPGIGRFELHMGPYHDFALFRGVQDEHRDHASPDNLLAPHIVEVKGVLGRRVWDVGGLRLEVSLAGGSRTDCESWFILLEPLEKTSH